MSRIARICREAGLPLCVFVAVFGAHYFWVGLSPERDPAQDRWVTVSTQEDLPWVRRYVETGSYWFGYCYAVTLSFAAVAYRRYRRDRVCMNPTFAVGGFTVSGLLSAAGCFLAGCCGSPMLIVYLNLLGPAFLPLAKPLIAGITTIVLAATWWLMIRRRPGSTAAAQENCHSCGEPAETVTPVCGR